MRFANASRILHAKCVIAACLWSMLGAERAGAASRYWIDPAGGDFGLTSNWSTSSGGPGGASVPVAADSATFDLNNTYEVDVIIGPTVTILNIDQGNVTFDLFGELVVTHPAAAFTVGGDAGLTGRLTLQDGTLRSDTAGDDFVVGDFGGTGFLTVEDGASLGTSTAAHKPTLRLGVEGGTGTLTARGRSDVFLTDFDVALHNASNGTATITGPLAQLSAASSRIGASGDGSLTINEGAQATFTGSLELGSSAPGEGEVHVAGVGTAVTTASLTVSNLGYGVLEVSAGGGVSSTTASIAAGAASAGDAVISGAGSRWSQASTLTVGNLGRGTLALGSGGFVGTTGAASVGSSASGVGTVSVSGSTSRWEIGGGLTVGGSGAGNLSITGGTVTSASGVIGSTATGVGNVLLTGASSRWATGAITVASSGTGTLNVSAGAMVEATGTITVNNPTGAPTGSLVIDGGHVLASGYVRGFDGSFVGSNFDFRDGSLTIDGGVFNYGASLSLNGADAGDRPTLRLIDGATANLGALSSLTVGAGRPGALEISGGSSLQATSIGLGADDGGDGLITVRGNGSSLSTTLGPLNVGGSTSSGGGSATITIETGGTVATAAGQTLRLWSGGVVNVNGGTLNFSSLTANGGTINFNAGRINQLGGLTADGALLDAVLGPAHELGVGRILSGEAGGATLNSSLTLTGGQIVTGTSFVNNGELHFAHSAAAVSASGTTNNGLIAGFGRINTPVTNNAAGQIRVADGQRLVIAGASTSNNGLIDVNGGEIEFSNVVNNATVSPSTGLIAARSALLRFNGGLQNAGSLTFTSGVSDVFGNVTNLNTLTTPGKIIVSGGSQANFFDDVTNGGVIQVSAAGSLESTAVFLGALTGNGAAGGGHVFLEGDARPGFSPGVMAFGGDLSFGPFASLKIELGGLLAGSQFDQVTVAGDMALGGDLAVSLINGHKLGAEQEYLIANVGGSLTGQFANLGEGALVATLNNRNLFITYVAGDGNDVALFTAPSFTADFDDDGDVDGNDLDHYWRPSFGPGAGADADGDGDSDGDDFLAWQRQLGSGPPSIAASAPVPEPTTLLPAIVAAACIWRRRRPNT